jgi:hypothetical protein
VSEKTTLDYINTVLEYRRIIVISISLVGIVLLDLTISSSLPFWLPPFVFGIIGGIIIGTAGAGLLTGLGTLIGRFISISIMILTMPGLLRTLDLFLAAIGDVLGAPLPPGSLFVILLACVICGLFGLLGGLVGGSATKLTRDFLEYHNKGE